MTLQIIPLISFVFITTFTPGPNNISSASMGINFGYRRTFNYLTGITVGFFIVMLACAYLSKALLELLPMAEQYLRWVGSGYIVWLAISILRTDSAMAETNPKSQLFIKGLVLQLCNPKVAVYGLTLYSTFLAPVSDHSLYLVTSAVIFALTAFLATSTWALFGLTIRARLSNPKFRKAINTLLPLLLLYTALNLSGIIA